MNDKASRRKSVVITGATSGIGKATALVMASKGYTIFATGRDPQRCASLEKELRALTPMNDDHTCFMAEMSSLTAVRGLAEAIKSRARELSDGVITALINNAGTYSSWYQATEDGFELQLAVNHLAPFLLTHELMDGLRSSGDGRVVIVSSASHYGSRFPFEDPNLLLRYGELRSYGRSKLANVLFGYELSRRLSSDSGVTVHVADPGLARTDMGFKGVSAIARAVWNIQCLRASPPERAAKGLAFLVSDDSVREQGGLYWRDSKPLRSSKASYDMVAAERLWSLSEDMCGIDSRSYGLGR